MVVTSAVSSKKPSLSSPCPASAKIFGTSAMENSVAAVLVSIEPAVATVIGVLCFDELPDALGWLGVALVLTALALLNLPARRREKQTK